VGALIDTSTLIAAERGEIDLDKVLRESFDDDVAIAAITASELLHGVHRLKGSVRQARAERFVEQILERLPIEPFDIAAARVHARLGAELAAKGVAIGSHDLIIAATAVSIDFDVITRDLRSFPRITGLTVRRW
jgi:tRNA(fMet)-specific endonuclease VapC